MDKITHEMRLNQWKQLIQECNNSGLSKHAWCKQNGVNEKQFYYWQRKIRQELYELQTVSSTQPAVFAEVPTPETYNTENIPNVSVAAAVIRKDGLSVEISEGISSELLLRLIGALSYA